MPSRLKTIVERSELERRWLQLTKLTLPNAARKNGWPIRHDHCFQRVLLDTACGGCWYDSIAGRPAYKAATDMILSRALAIGENVMMDKALLPRLNRQSLEYRSKT